MPTMTTVSRAVVLTAAGAAALTLAVLLPGSSARADVKLVTETTFTGVGQNNPGPVAGAIYYKGDKQRTESGDQVTIYDCGADTLYTLNAKAKTYTVTTSPGAQGAAANPLLAMMKIDTKEVSLAPQPGTKQIAGKDASRYTYTLVLHIAPSDPSLADYVPSFTTSIQGEQWTAASLAPPATCARMARMLLTRNLPPTMAGAGSGIKVLADKAAEMKGLFLSSRVQFTVKPDAKSADTGVPLPKNPIVVATDVKSLSEAPLDDSLFTVPTDYKKIESGTPGAAPPPVAAPAAPQTSTAQ